MSQLENVEEKAALAVTGILDDLALRLGHVPVRIGEVARRWRKIVVRAFSQYKENAVAALVVSDILDDLNTPRRRSVRGANYAAAYLTHAWIQLDTITQEAIKSAWSEIVNQRRPSQPEARADDDALLVVKSIVADLQKRLPLRRTWVDFSPSIRDAIEQDWRDIVARTCARNDVEATAILVLKDIESDFIIREAAANGGFANFSDLRNAIRQTWPTFIVRAFSPPVVK